MIKVFTDSKIKKLLTDICNEHWVISQPEDSNIGYLWSMYVNGSRKGNYKPFIFLSELSLLTKTGYITEDEKQNMLNMLLSEDEDNAHITAYSILTFRNSRVKEMGLWTLDNTKYKHLKYKEDILDLSVFTKKIK